MKRHLNTLLFSGAILFGSFNQAMAIQGEGRIGDCGQQLVRPDADFNLLKFLPGDMPLPNDEDCKYSAVGTTFVLPKADEWDPVPEGSLLQICSGSLIHVDDKKAVFLYAAHCSRGGFDIAKYVTFEPQPVMPYSELPGEVTGWLVGGRDASLTQNLFEVEGVLIHPGYSWPYNDFALIFLDNSAGQIDSLNIQPMRVPDEINYLDEYKASQLQKMNMVGVGYDRLQTILAQDPNAKPGIDSLRDDIAQHNRTYGALDFVNKGHNVLGYKGWSAVRVNQQAQAGRNGVCHGDSGGPLIIEDNLVIGVAAVITILGAGDAECTLQGFYGRTDSPAVYDFIRCGTDPDKSISKAMEQCS